MKLNTNSSLKLISLFPLVLLVVWSGYFAFTNYKEYESGVKLQEKLVSNHIIKNLSLNLARERGLSAAYYGSHGQIAIEKLREQREETNRAIEKFKNYFKDKKIDPTLTDIFENLNKISTIRNKTDQLNITFNKMFFGYYSVINAEIIDEYRTILNDKLTPRISSYINYEIKLLSDMEKSGQERGFISYILATKKPFTLDEYKKWMSLFTKVNYAKLDIQFSAANLRMRLFSLFDSQNAKALYQNLVKAKVDIIKGSQTGNYQIDPNNWFVLMTKKIKLLNGADDIVSQEINQDIQTFFDTKIKPMFLISMILLVMFILLLIVGYFIERYIGRSINELEKLFSKVGQLAEIDEDIDFQTTEGIEKGYRIIEIAIDQIQQDKQIALEASRAKSIFLANMSHEIRTPLNGIIGFTELLKNTDISGEERDFVDIIEKSSENLLEIINNILDLSKIESDKIEIEEILFSPIDEFENAVEVFGAKAAEKNIRLSFYMDPSLDGYLSGDPTKIKEVLINLLSNAVKFTPTDGEIDVEIRRVGSINSFGKTKVQFSVKDNGIGISEDKLKTIFDAFSQADSTITRKYGGTGLGLTISSKFVALMGGKLEVESKTNEGTKFYFSIEFDESPSSEHSFKDKFLQYKCALLANEEDKKNHTQYIYDYLKYFGCEIHIFNSLKEIKGLMFRENINFMVLDVDYIDDSEVEDYKKMQIPAIIILKSSMQSISSKYTNDLIKSLYEPVNVTKMANILEKQKDLLPEVSSISFDDDFEENDEKSVSTEENNNKEIVENVEQEDSDSESFDILVAEDNEINRKLIKRTLENYGANITLANNGSLALEQVKNKKFDLIFMDIAMPVMDGVEALHAILDYELSSGQRHTPVVALTANALKGDRERFLDEGFDEYITKPIKGEKIEFVLNMFVGEKYNNALINKDSEEKKDIEDEHKSDQNDIKSNDDSIVKKEKDKDKKDGTETEKLKVNLDVFDEKDHFRDNNDKNDNDEDDDFFKEPENDFFAPEEESENKELSADENKDEFDIKSKEFDEDTLKTEEEIQIPKESEIKNDEIFQNNVAEEESSQEKVAQEENSQEKVFEKEIVENKVHDEKPKDRKKIITGSNIFNIDALIAEDNMINQKLIEKTLKNLGLSVDIANNGEEAVRKFKNQEYDIVFMDISMPVMDGIEATHEILAYEKANAKNHTPIVALTANALPGDREAFLSEGLDEYISKPLKKEDIIKVLNLFFGHDYKQENTQKEEDKTNELSYENLNDSEDTEERNFFDTEYTEDTDFGSVPDELKENGKMDESVFDDQKREDEFDLKDVDNADIFEEEAIPQKEKTVDFEEEELLIFKNNKIESKILNNMIEKMGYSSNVVDNFDEFMENIDKKQYKVVFLDKEIDSLDSKEIIDMIRKMDHNRERKSIIVEFVNSKDTNKEEDLVFVDEIIENIINKAKIKAILEKYI